MRRLLLLLVPLMMACCVEIKAQGGLVASANVKSDRFDSASIVAPPTDIDFKIIVIDPPGIDQAIVSCSIPCQGGSAQLAIPFRSRVYPSQLCPLIRPVGATRNLRRGHPKASP